MKVKAQIILGQVDQYATGEIGEFEAGLIPRLVELGVVSVIEEPKPEPQPQPEAKPAAKVEPKPETKPEAKTGGK